MYVFTCTINGIESFTFAHISSDIAIWPDFRANYLQTTGLGAKLELCIKIDKRNDTLKISGVRRKKFRGGFKVGGPAS